VVPRSAAAALTAAAILWVVVILTSPIALAHGYVVLPTVVYEIGGMICHQKPERSFHLLGIQLPVCARCFGLYGSGAAGALVAYLGPAVEPSSSRLSAAILGLAALPTAVSVGSEWLGILHPGSAARAIAAIPLGLAAAWLFVRALRAQPGSARPLDRMRYHS
jgi:uncharacterized membrane protein